VGGLTFAWLFDERTQAVAHYLRGASEHHLTPIGEECLRCIVNAIHTNPPGLYSLRIERGLEAIQALLSKVLFPMLQDWGKMMHASGTFG
jgi:hypothetical protein